MHANARPQEPSELGRSSQAYTPEVWLQPPASAGPISACQASPVVTYTPPTSLLTETRPPFGSEAHSSSEPLRLVRRLL